jgi:hypothetical protein
MATSLPVSYFKKRSNDFRVSEVIASRERDILLYSSNRRNASLMVRRFFVVALDTESELIEMNSS